MCHKDDALCNFYSSSSRLSEAPVPLLNCRSPANRYSKVGNPTGTSDMPPAGHDFFYFGICHFCKSAPEQIQRCASCKTVAYCGKHHQKRDWKSHRDLCKAIALTSKTAVEGCTFEEWKNYRVYCQLAWTKLLKRQLEPFEAQMWMFPRACGVCHSRDNLKDCSECRNVAYCSSAHEKQHREVHDQFCRHLRLCMDVDSYLAKENAYPQPQLSERIGGIGPRDMNELIDLVGGPRCDEQVERVLRADCATPGATIAYAMKQLEKFPGELTIHVVGAASTEATTDWSITSELIFHLNEDLVEIGYVLIGPEAWPISEKLELCAVCQAKGRASSVRVHKRLYHEVVDSVERPDLVVSFNSGLHEFEGQDGDDWRKSIPCLLKNPEVPFVFTSYTEEEMLKDLQRLRSVPCAQLSVLACGKNPFASPRPIRDWCTRDIPVFYSNGYIAIVKRQQQ